MLSLHNLHATCVSGSVHSSSTETRSVVNHSSRGCRDSSLRKRGITEFRQRRGIVTRNKRASLSIPFGDSHRIFDQLPEGALQTKPLRIDVAFWCYQCGGMASGRTCPHGDADRLQVSGTQLRKWLGQGNAVPAEFSRPEVLEVLQAYYSGQPQT